MIEIVSGTRLSKEEFWEKSALGISLNRISFDTRLVPHIFFSNRRGLPDIYNERIESNDGHAVLVFVHDDVWIDDFFLADHVMEGLEEYDIIGVAGNRRRINHQPAWAFVDDNFTWDERSNLTGCVAHGKHPFGTISFYGSVPASCELLDGVFLAAKKSVLIASGILFDPMFNFHFYDMDFCRSARKRGLKLGTWSIPLTHQSGGSFNSDPWLEKRNVYRKKWGD